MLCMSLIFATYVFMGYVSSAPSSDCIDLTIECYQTEYTEYVKCIDDKRQHFRSKRDAACPFAVALSEAADLPCEQVSANCIKSCNGIAACQSQCPICPSVIPVESGNVPISAGYDFVPTQTADIPISAGYDVIPAPSDVPISAGYDFVPVQTYQPVLGGQDVVSPCTECSAAQIYEPGPVPVHQTVVVQGENENRRFDISPAHNITTVIKLNNIINNTNEINVPTNVSTNNVNHIHIYANASDTGGDYGLGYNQNGSCCFAIRPKSCSTTTSGYRCHHKRHKTCGPQCSSRLIHVQARKRCQKSGNCSKRVAYVPQPERPSCVYIDEWPHVSCGGDYQQSSCAGCYDHYGYGHENYYDQSSQECSGCYDDAFNIGPRYRRGPVLRPFYYHQPPCYMTGSCYGEAPMCNEYGCFRNEYVDPAWSAYTDDWPHKRPHHYIPSEFDDDIIDSGEIVYDPPPGNETGGMLDEGSGNASDWAVQIHKCRVVLDDGTYEIRNCTSMEVEDNPYASNPTDYARERRHTRNQRHRVPIYYDRDNRVDDYSEVEDERQFIRPYHHGYDSYDRDKEEFENYRRSKRHNQVRRSYHSKRNRIIYDDEDDDDDVDIY